MNKHAKRFISIRIKMYIFIVLTVLLVSSGTIALCFITSVIQIDEYYKRCASDNARNFASYVDPDFIKRLEQMATDAEYQELRDKAEELDDDSSVKEYLKQKGLWEEYISLQSLLDDYMNNMEDIKYLYIVDVAPADALMDMYLMDSSEEPLYQTGYWEDREVELQGLDLSKGIEPTISTGDWGWLCSAYSAVYDESGTAVCIVGCDFDMEVVMAERYRFLLYAIVGAIGLTLMIVIVAVFFVRWTIVNPINRMIKSIESFRPVKTSNISYSDAGVLDVNIKSHDEIKAIHDSIYTMQTNIVDYLNDLYRLQEDKIIAERMLDSKDKEIEILSDETSRDHLTGVGSNYAYAKKIMEINEEMVDGNINFAVVMVDMNNLKKINDNFGHKAGDKYIKGCCKMVCEVFKHSPVFRVGGDEFVAVLQGSDYENRENLFDRLKSDFLEKTNDEKVEPWLRYSASIGMAENAAEDATYSTVFCKADKEMYADKLEFRKIHGAYRDTRDTENKKQ